MTTETFTPMQERQAKAVEIFEAIAEQAAPQKPSPATLARFAKRNSEAPASTKTDSETSSPKKVYVRKPHLTDRPLSHNPELEALKEKLESNKRQNHKGGRPPRHAKGHKPQPRKTR